MFLDEVIGFLKQHYADVKVYHHQETGQPAIYITKDGQTIALVGFNFNGLKVNLPEKP